MERAKGFEPSTIHLGKVMLYQTELRSLPRSRKTVMELKAIASSLLLEIVNNSPFADALENLLYELDVQGVYLVIVLRLP